MRQFLPHTFVMMKRKSGNWQGGGGMPYKTCPDCRQISYSADDMRCWYCPCCGESLIAEPLIRDHRCLLLRPGRHRHGLLHFPAFSPAAEQKRTV